MPKMAWRLSILGMVALIVGSAASAGAQSPPVRVMQGPDGSLYVVQGTEAWVLVPDAASDDDVAALDLRGEMDGTLPSEVLASPAPPFAVPASPDAPAPDVSAPVPPPVAPANTSPNAPPTPAPTAATTITRRALVTPAPVSVATSTPVAPSSGLRK